MATTYTRTVGTERLMDDKEIKTAENNGIAGSLETHKKAVNCSDIHTCTDSKEIVI